MPIFDYELRKKQGEIEKGGIAAISYDHAAKRLAVHGGELIKLYERKEGFLEKFSKAKKRDVIIFTRGLSTLQKAGVSMIDSLNSLTEMVGNAKMRKIGQETIMAVESGVSLSDALARFPDVFERLYISMIKVAEASGKLDAVLERLYQTYEKEEDLNAQLKSAMAYPMVVTIAITGIIFFILTFVVPKFVKTFSNIGVDLPVATQILIKVSYFLKTKYFVITPAIIAVLFLFRKALNIRRIRLIYDTAKLKIPIVGGLMQQMALSRFTKGLQILLDSGIPILESLELIRSTLGNEGLSCEIKEMASYISKGGSITDFIKLRKMFPLLVTQMISVGEESGTLAKMLGEVADFYEVETQRALKTLLSMLEPLMIVTMGLIVGGILITLMMPLFSMMKGASF